MDLLVIIFIGIFGLIVGSYLNATAGRWGTSRQNARRSKCFTCGQTLRAKNLIPVLSWLWQQGKCSACHSRLSPRYPLVEVATAAILVAIWLSAASWSGFVVSSIIALIMIMIALIDLDQFIIPHELSLPLILISFLLLFFDPIHLLPTYPTVLELLAGPILAGFFWLLWAITKGRGMGFADGTLSLSIGWLLGLSAGATAVLLAFWIGAAVSLIILAGQKLMPNQSSGKQLGMKSAVPFGPYLITGYIIVSIPKLDLLDNFNLFLL